jgi:hypothetical protein
MRSNYTVLNFGEPVVRFLQLSLGRRVAGLIPPVAGNLKRNHQLFY